MQEYMEGLEEGKEVEIAKGNDVVEGKRMQAPSHFSIVKGKKRRKGGDACRRRKRKLCLGKSSDEGKKERCQQRGLWNVCV